MPSVDDAFLITLDSLKIRANVRPMLKEDQSSFSKDSLWLVDVSSLIDWRPSHCVPALIGRSQLGLVSVYLQTLMDTGYR